MKHHPESGNILFLILLAVVLFAALAYAVTNSMRGGGKSSSSESIQAKTASITQFLDQIDAALMRMQMINGIKPENISFEYQFMNYTNYLASSNPSNFFINSNCTSDACRVFKPDGGGVTARNFAAYGVDDFYGLFSGHPAPGYYMFMVGQWPHAGTDLNDIYIEIRGVDPDICTELNKSLGISGSITWSGTATTSTNTANWDSASYYVTSGQNNLLGKSTYGSLVSSGGSGTKPSCWVRHLLITR